MELGIIGLARGLNISERLRLADTRLSAFDFIKRTAKLTAAVSLASIAVGPGAESFLPLVPSGHVPQATPWIKTIARPSPDERVDTLIDGCNSTTRTRAPPPEFTNRCFHFVDCAHRAALGP